MVVGEVGFSTEVLVVGGGPGGYVAALRAAAAGRKVTLVERDRIGGVCLNVGCIPSKALIHAADVAALPAEAAQWGIDMSVSVDMLRLQKWIGEVVGRLTGGVSGLLEAAGVVVETGSARFTSPHRVAVVADGHVQHIEFEQAIAATGSRPVELSTLPFDGARVLDSTGALALEQVPERMVVVGGGYIGLELGTAYAKLGSRVSVVELTDRLLPEVDAGLARVVEGRLRALGVEVVLSAEAEGLDDEGVVAKSRDQTRTIPADVVVVAVGRRPNTDELGLEVAGAELAPSGHVLVDKARRAARTVCAIGDLTLGPALAHKAMAEADVAAATVSGRRAAYDPACVPAVVYTDPEVATVGRTAAQAREEGVDPSTFRYPLTASARALTLGRPEGYVEVVADKADGTVLGVHMVGPGVGELAGEAALAVEMSATVDDLALTIHPHPTLSEAVAESALGAACRPLHVRRG